MNCEDYFKRIHSKCATVCNNVFDNNYNDGYSIFMKIFIYRFLNVLGINLILKSQNATLFVSYLFKRGLSSINVKNLSTLFLVFKMLITMIIIVFQDWKLNVRQTNDEYWLNFYNVKFII